MTKLFAELPSNWLNGINHLKIFGFTILMATVCPIHSQVQVGNDIDGENSGDLSGHAIALSSDGNRLAVGAPVNDGNGSSAGHVRVYNWDGLAWVQLGLDIDAEATGDQSGYSISMSGDGNILAIGAISNSDNGSNAGHVRIYNWDGSKWHQLGADLDGEAANDQSGRAVSLSHDGTRVAIGSRQNQGNGLNSGHVRIYEWDANLWKQVGMDIDSEATGDQAGSSVSLSNDGNRLAIGARFNNGNGGNAGQVRVYEWNNSKWTQLGLDIDGEAAGDQFGWSVSFAGNGNRLAVGAPPNDGNGDHAGHVRVFSWDGINWVQMGNDIDGEAIDDRSGTAVSMTLNGDRIAVGAINNNGNGSNAGQVRVYDWNGLNWMQIGSDIDGEAISDESGTSVRISNDGNRLAIGAPGNDGNGNDAGHVRVYEFPVSNVTHIIEEGLKIFPNPATEILHLPYVSIIKVEIFDKEGRLLLKENTPEQTVDVSGMSPGIYLLKITSRQKVYSAQLVKH